MRLIDVEKIKIQEIYDEDLKAHFVVEEDDLKERPVVKAIPISWIKNYASHKASKDLIDCYWHFWEDDVLKMVTAWEKENETN